MRVHIDSHFLSSALNTVSKLNSTMPIRIDAKNNRVFDNPYDITLSRFNQNTEVYVSLVDGLISEEGSVELPVGLFNTVRGLKDIELLMTDRFIESGKVRIGLPTTTPNPVSSTKFEGNKIFEITEAELLKLLYINYATTQDGFRPILSGICFKLDEACACDGFRLAVRRGEFIEVNNDTFVLNNDTVGLLSKVLDKKSSSVVSAFKSDKAVKFVIEDGHYHTEIIGQIIQGEFINYKQIIPNDSRHTCKIQAEVLYKELKPLKGKINILKFKFDKTEITYSAEIGRVVYDKDASDRKTRELMDEAEADHDWKLAEWKQAKAAAESKKKSFKKPEPKLQIIKPQTVKTFKSDSVVSGSVPCQFDGDSFEIHFNHRYIIEALQQYQGEVAMKMSTSVSPLIITQDGHNLELVLPVRIVG